MSQASEHFIPTTNTFVTVILPMAVPKPYTYYVPEEWVDKVRFGVRVEVQFGKSRQYTALVIDVHGNPPPGHQPKPLLSVVAEQPLINPLQLKLWQWIGNYYCCTLGEVMHAALPSNLKLASETLISLSPVFDGDVTDLSEKEHIVVQALTAQHELSIEDLRKILDQKTVYPFVKSLLEKKIIYLQEDLKTKYSPKTIGCVRLREPYASNPELMGEAFDKLSRSERQTEALMAYLKIAKTQEFIRKQDIYNIVPRVDASVLNAMAKKKIIELYDREVSRLGAYEEETIDSDVLSLQQDEAIAQLRVQLEEKNVALLHGVTGSGKTRVYVELMQEALTRGEQVLYLLPEIALTAQIISRLQKIFGDDIAVYHSRLNSNERVELWKEILNGKPIVLGARSALFMPFKNLKLVIVDEEHDPSYKQNDPNPRYNGRDAAIYMAQTFGAKVILGTATPSIESYYNAKSGKYGLVEMPERFGGLELPETIIADVKQELKERKLQSHFTTTLIDELKAALERGEQAILFQNRRGFAPTYRCTTCGWHAECIHCDVSLTYHKHFNALKCHYCGYQTKLPTVCPACGAKELTLIGFGTEKIEDELKIYLPEASIKRMDLDTVRSKNAHGQIINDFEERRIDILVGTQMVTKGLDFDNVAIVGVLSADQLLQFPDFRATERGFQLMLQVSGRAGRKHKRGKVIIQAMNTAHPVLGEVIRNDFLTFFQRELQERHQFQYPPFARLIRITIKHKKPDILNQGGKILEKSLKSKLGEWVIGPAVPYVGRVRGYFLLDFLIKLPRDSQKIRFAKDSLLDAISALNTTEGYTTIRANVDVDPY